MRYQLITVKDIEINEKTGKATIIKERSKMKKIEEKQKIIKGVHVLKRSEPQYGIISFSRQESEELYKTLPSDTDITVVFEGKEYLAHTHQNIVGRLGRLSNFYRTHREFEENSKIEVEYDTKNKILTIIKIK